MALQTSGAISLNDLHVEAGGASGTSATINDTDIRAIISKASGAAMSFSEWYGASAMTWVTPSSVSDSDNSSSGASATAYLRLQSDETWDTVGSTSDTNNKFLPSNPEYTTLYYKVTSKSSTISGTGVSSSYTAITSQHQWSINAFSNGDMGRLVQKSGSITISIATSSSGANAKSFTCSMTATANYTGVIN